MQQLNYREKYHYWALALLLIAKLALQYWALGTGYELHRDEFLHLDQGHHLAWGYASVPPFTSWISWLIIQLGNSVFWVKFFPALWGLLTILLVWKTAESLGAGILGKTLAATCVLLSSLVRINILYQPNSVDILCWTALIYFLIRYLQQRSPSWLYAAAVVFAIGFLNKYNIGFLLAALLAALLLSPQRKLLREPHLYGAAALALLLISPNLIWQLRNDFPVLTQMKELASTQLIHVNRTDFLFDQLLFFPGAIVLVVASLIGLLIHQDFRPLRLLFASFLFTLLLFLYFKAKSYYAIGLYPAYIAIGAAYLDKVWNHGWKKFLKTVLFLLPVISFIPIARVAFPTHSPEYIANHPKPYERFDLLRWEDGQQHQLPQDFADMLGWSELTHKTEKALSTGINPSETILICDNYGQAGAINFYTRMKNLRAHSFNADYIGWFPLNREFRNVVLVKEAGEGDLKELEPYFEKISVADSLTNSYARERGAKIWVLQNSRISVRDYLAKTIKERMANPDSD